MKFSGAFTVLASLAVAAHADEDCYLPLDVLFLQDTTGSFDDDLPNVLRQVPDIVKAVTEKHPDSYFGVAEFKDKPYYPMGEDDDFCYKLGSKLSPDVSDMEYAYKQLYASGGGDLPEAQFQALISAAYDQEIGWRRLGQAAKGDVSVAGARLIIISTDAAIHLPGDMDKYRQDSAYASLPKLAANSGKFTQSDKNQECKKQDYPAPEQVLAALREKDIYVAILTPEDPVCDEHGGHCANINPTWKWVNEELLQQEPGFYQNIKSDSSDFINAVLGTVDAVTRTACAKTTTTGAPTNPPATTKTTTTTSTTKPTTATTASTTTTTYTTTIATTKSTAPSTVTTTAAAKPTTITTTSQPTTTTSITTTPEPTTTTTTPEPTTATTATTTPSQPTECPTADPCADDHCRNLPVVVVKAAEKPKKLHISYDRD